MTDILKAMDHARRQADMHRHTPASYTIRDISTFKDKVQGFTLIKDDGRKTNKFEYCGIKVVQNVLVPENMMVVKDHRGEIIDIIKFE